MRTDSNTYNLLWVPDTKLDGLDTLHGRHTGRETVHGARHGVRLVKTTTKLLLAVELPLLESCSQGSPHGHVVQLTTQLTSRVPAHSLDVAVWL